MKEGALKSNQWYPLQSSQPDTCVYLEDRHSLLEVGLIVPDLPRFDKLMQKGYRRQGLAFYRPACVGCQECTPIRVPIAGFKPSKSQRRVWRKWSDRFEVTVGKPRFDAAHFEMYCAHALQVSAKNEPSDAEDYTSGFLASLAHTHLIEYRLDGELAAVSILDEGHLAVSSVYVFWNEAARASSPGTFSALWEIEWARSRGHEHYYLGYWIADCDRMNYKNRFGPYELYDWSRGEWSRPE